jgi:hypothetical protein
VVADAAPPLPRSLRSWSSPRSAGATGASTEVVRRVGRTRRLPLSLVAAELRDLVARFGESCCVSSLPHACASPRGSSIECAAVRVVRINGKVDISPGIRRARFPPTPPENLGCHPNTGRTKRLSSVFCGSWAGKLAARPAARHTLAAPAHCVIQSAAGSTPANHPATLAGIGSAVSGRGTSTWLLRSRLAHRLPPRFWRRWQAWRRAGIPDASLSPAAVHAGGTAVGRASSGRGTSADSALRPAPRTPAAPPRHTRRGNSAARDHSPGTPAVARRSERNGTAGRCVLRASTSPPKGWTRAPDRVILPAGRRQPISSTGGTPTRARGCYLRPSPLWRPLSYSGAPRGGNVIRPTGSFRPPREDRSPNDGTCRFLIAAPSFESAPFVNSTRIPLAVHTRSPRSGWRAACG